MAITVEDGTCKNDAESYVSEADALAFVAKYVKVPDETKIPVAIREGHAWLYTQLESSVAGTACPTGSPFLNFPRVNCYDRNRNPVTGIPTNLVVASLWITLYFYLYGGMEAETAETKATKVDIEGLLRVDMEASSQASVESGSMAKLCIQQVFARIEYLKVYGSRGVMRMFRTS